MRRGRVFLITALIAVVFPAHAALGQSSVTGSNTSSGSDAASGDANGTNSANSQTGLQTDQNGDGGGGASNVQDGNNTTRINQTTNVTTGDAMAGQVIGGVVNGGSLTINATNRSENVSVTTGDAEGENTANVITGLVAREDNETAFVNDANPTLTPDGISNVVGRNIQDGNNTSNVRQSVTAQSGNGIGGQVIGAVVNGGTTSITADNTTLNSDITTGNVDGSNSLDAFVGLLSESLTVVLGPPGFIFGENGISNVSGTNIQDGNNRLNVGQTVQAQSGDGIGGQVIGVVSSGNTSVDARNRTEDSSIVTGDASADNDADAFVGLRSKETTVFLPVSDDNIQVLVPLGEFELADLSNVSGTNVQDGNNVGNLRQTAQASSGDAVGGQVAGIVTTAGASASVVLANTTLRTDTLTGDADFSNDSSLFTGLVQEDETFIFGLPRFELNDGALSEIFQAAVT